MALVAASVLAADFLKLADECEMVNESAADWFHVDVMDGHFVPNISFGPMVLAFIKKIATKPCDVHLMIEQPSRYFEAFQKAGADHLAVHLEACPMLHQDIMQIKALGMKPGVAINPHTPVSLLSEIIQELHEVIVMSVNPGFGGQQFIPHTLEKIKELRALMQAKNTNAHIVIDGGVNASNAPDILQAGADVLVAGSFVFGASDPKGTVAALKAL
ncbi:MAG: ribulose-phosphate 3-epimerase [Niabella sp.]